MQAQAGWVESFGGAGWADGGRSVAVDGAGNSYVTGYFQGSADFDGDGNGDATSAGGYDMFLAYYPASALPVELTAFSATLDHNAARLAWQTASETNNAGFHIEHLAPGADTFSTIGFVEGHGTTATARHYSFQTPVLAPGRHTFRLRQVDFDGAFAYSPEVEVAVEMTERFVLEAAYPNPFNPQAQLRFAVREAQPVRVVLYNSLGQAVETLYRGVPSSGEMVTVRIDGSALVSGTYYVRLEGEGVSAVKAVTLMK